VSKYFPCGVGVSRPQGGFMLWIELDERLDAQRLNRLLEVHKVQIAIGSIFSASGKYRNCLRINYAQPLTEAYEQAVKHIGQTINDMMAEL
jgi:DNA-binding transcriptional MocR family regulator